MRVVHRLPARCSWQTTCWLLADNSQHSQMETTDDRNGTTQGLDFKCPIEVCCIDRLNPQPGMAIVPRRSDVDSLAEADSSRAGRSLSPALSAAKRGYQRHSVSDRKGTPRLFH